MGIIQAVDGKGVLAAWDFSKPQNNCKSSNIFSPFIRPDNKPIYKENIATLSKTNATHRISTDIGVNGIDFTMYF